MSRKRKRNLSKTKVRRMWSIRCILFVMDVLMEEPMNFVFPV
jgi:hypothetical protein